MSNTPEFKWDDSLVKDFVCILNGKRALTQIDNEISLFKSQHSSSGREIFNWVVFTNEGFGFDTWSPKDWRGDKGSNWDESVKTFITLESAKDYINLNKPVLAVSDIRAILIQLSQVFERDINKYTYNEELNKIVFNLAQSKINPL